MDAATRVSAELEMPDPESDEFEGWYDRREKLGPLMGLSANATLSFQNGVAVAAPLMGVIVALALE